MKNQLKKWVKKLKVFQKYKIEKLENEFDFKDKALKDLKNGADSTKVINEFIFNITKKNPNFINGPFPKLLLSFKNKPERLYEFINELKIK